MESTIRLRLLGPVQIERDGEPVRGFESRKALALLGYLALQGQPVPREHLVDLLWGDKSEARGRANLSWVLHRISTLLPGCLQADRHTVQFQGAAPSTSSGQAPSTLRQAQDSASSGQAPSTLRQAQDSAGSGQAPYWLDIVAFEELEAQGDAASLAAAVELYRGEFLEGLYLRGCPEFEIWLVGERERWRQRVARVLEALVTYHTRRGEHQQSLRFAQRLLALEPWREETHRQVMRLLAYSDQRGAALAQYETCRRVLAEELGVEPAAETTQLYEQIRDGELEIPVSLQAVTRKHNLPAQLTPFVGREAALAEIADRLQDPTCRLLTLVGPGGCGKTRLALEAAAAQVDNYAHGVFFASLAPLDSAEAIVPTVAEALGFRFYEGGKPQQQLLDYLHHKAMLIIMDNFEHLLDGVGLVTDVLKTAPEVTILATSRARLNVQGEHLFPVAGMSFPDEETAEDASQYSAVRLFLQSACQAQPAFEVTTDSLADAARICRLVQGMPLGILLAAAWVRMLTPAEIADQISGEIGQSLDFLEADLRDVPQRQRSMRAVFDHSYRLLTQREREVFQALSSFVVASLTRQPNTSPTLRCAS